ncbi:MAG: hypothetical protein PHH85_07895 [Candidatus Methanoperedens sp.]|nr:hypothetical protein [Candidatus Methanoperedens sp.]
MKFVEKCPKCKGEVQTKSLKKSIGLGFVKIPVSQFCLNPSCDWYQDFTEAKSPEELDQDVLQLKIPLIKNRLPGIRLRVAELKEKTPDIIKQNMLVVKGAIAVIVFSIFLVFVLSFLRP